MKQQLLARVDEKRRPGTIVSTNTSGIPIAALAEGRSDDFRRHWLGTHFFNPPRYLRLLELIPTAETDPSVMATVTRVRRSPARQGRRGGEGHAELHRQSHRALRGRVHAAGAGHRQVHDRGDRRDHRARHRTPRLRHLPDDGHRRRRRAGPRDAQPERAARRCRRPRRVRGAGLRGPDDRARTTGREGRARASTSGARTTRASPKSGRSTSTTLDYRPKKSAKIGSIEAGRSIDDLGERIRMLFASKDKAGEFLRDTLAPTLVYTARVTPEIAHSIDDVDRVMRWGFGWDLGPFELFDTHRRARGDGRGQRGGRPRGEGRTPAARADGARGQGATASARASSPPPRPTCRSCAAARDQQRVVKKNAGASLVDLGDGVLSVEFHSKMNAIGGDTITMLQAGREGGGEELHRALVVGNDAPNFSAGANLMLVLLEAQEGQLGRARPDGAAVPAGDDGAPLRRGAGGGGAGRADARRRHAKSCCTATACRRRPRPTWAWWKSASGSFPPAAAPRRCSCAPWPGSRRRRAIRCRTCRRRSRPWHSRRCRPAGRTPSGSAISRRPTASR